MSTKEVSSILKSFDDSRSDTLEYEEFLSYIRMLGSEANARIRDICSETYCVLSSLPNKRYIPPKTGKIIIQISMSYESINSSNVFAITESQVIYIYILY